MKTLILLFFIGCTSSMQFPKTIHNVRYGMTEKEVTRKLGWVKPVKVEYHSHEYVKAYTYRDKEYYFTFDNVDKRLVCLMIYKGDEALFIFLSDRHTFVKM